MADLRIMVFDRLDHYLFDIDMGQLRDATYVEAVNGEHSVTLKTTQTLEKTNRLLMRDGMGIWHEYVVLGVEELHDSMEYYCIWSMQYDLMCTFINGPYDCGIVPGHASVPQLPHRALEVSLGGTSRWEIGTITLTTMAAASFYRRSGWEGLQTVLEKWGGELQATITVGQNGVLSRSVDLLEHVGTSDATRRFDYGFDLKGIKRTISDDIWPCRIVPLGKSQQTENGGYTRRPSIGSVNDGVLWLQDDSVVEEVRILNPDGEYEYPTKIIQNDTYEEPADVKAWALEHITEYTRPKVTYEANVLQFEQAGLNAHGVALGDNVVAVDRTFKSGELRIDARVTKIAGSLLDTSDMTLTIGNIAESITGQFGGLSYSLDQLTETVDRSQQWQATAAYLSNLLNRLNEECNATGGYTYVTEGEGLRTYDKPVSDPLVGSEATQVVEIKGGNIRIANSRTQAGDWDWKTVLVSGHIAAELVTAARITAGYIGNAAGSYWDLDNNVLHIATGAQLGNKTVQEVLDTVSATITDVDVEYAQGTSPTTAPTTGWGSTAPAYEQGKYIWTRTATTTPEGTTYSTPVMISGRDGADGTNGTNGTDGLSGYVHTAWANSADGTTDFSTTASANKKYLGVYTDNTAADSTTPSKYSWSLIKGTDGTNGTDGVGISSIAEQYYLSTSSTTQTGGSWGTTQPAWESGKYIWTRSHITWDNGNTTTTTPVLAKAINGANENAKQAIDDAAEAAKVATNYLDFDAAKGLDIGYSGTQAKTRISGTGMEVFDGEGRSAIEISSDADGSTARIGDADAAHATVDYRSFNLEDKDGAIFFEASDLRGANGYATVSETLIGDGTLKRFVLLLGFEVPPGETVDSSTSCTVDGVELTYKSSGTGNYYRVVTSYAGNVPTSSLYIMTASAPANGAVIELTYTTASARAKSYTMGVRGSGIKGTLSLVEGNECVASGFAAHAEGNGSAAIMTGAHAEGLGSVASGEYSHAEGGWTNHNLTPTIWHSTASGASAHAEGQSTASGRGSHAEGYSTASSTWAHSEGYSTTASGLYSHAEGQSTVATAQEAHAEGRGTEASGRRSHAEGYSTVASGDSSHAGGEGTIAEAGSQTAIGKYNVSHASHLLIVGKGSGDTNRSNAMYLTNSGALWIASTLTQNSDRRLKKHHAYLGEDACDFVRSLKPALYTKDGERHLGFYAQDVQEAEPEGWDTATVSAQHTDESLDYDPLTLDYTALIAPLTAYAQSLERRIAELEKAIQMKEGGKN